MTPILYARPVEGSGLLEARERANGQEPEKDATSFYRYLVGLSPLDG